MGAPLKLVRKMTKAVMTGVEAHEAGPAYQALCERLPLIEISSKEQHQNALKVIEHLIDFLSRDEAAPLADDVNQYLAVLGDLVAKFEHVRFPSKRVAGNEILSQLMEAHNLKQTDLGGELGGQSVVSLILRGERELNVRQIRALAERFKVSPEIFL